MMHVLVIHAIHSPSSTHSNYSLYVLTSAEDRDVARTLHNQSLREETNEKKTYLLKRLQQLTPLQQSLVPGVQPSIYPESGELVILFE